jgi:dihydroorotate dehydrogenase electron transfer subunit
MKTMDYTIVENRSVARQVYRLVLRADDPSFAAGGEFVNLALDGFFLRRPISICETEPGRLVLYYKVVGEGTKALAALGAGDRLNLLTGLGKSFDASRCRSKALLVGGGLGAAPLYPLARELAAAGKEMSVILGFGTAEDVVLEAEFRALCPDTQIVTMDGSAGMKGLVTDAIDALSPAFDFYYTCGPGVMMRAVSAQLGTNGQASLEERMGCGAGYCWCCSCKTTDGPRRTCTDGPVFDVDKILW